MELLNVKMEQVMKVCNNNLFYGTKQTPDNIIYKGEWNKRCL